MTDRLAAMLEVEEGRRRSVYQDSLGYWTIGIGRLVDGRMGGGLSDVEIDYLLANDIKAKTAEVRKALPWIDSLDEPRQAVLIGMAFQMGTSGLLKFVNTLRAVREGRYVDAAAGMMQSAWARQTPARAQRMADQMESGTWPT